MTKILYFVQRFRPIFEATSKEVEVLYRNNQDSFLYDHHLEGYFKSKSAKRFSSHHFLFYPLKWPYLFLKSRLVITHIYTGVPDSVYLPSLSKKKMIITSTNHFSQKYIYEKLRHLKKVQKIIVQSDTQKDILLSCNIPTHKIEIILPPVDLAKFKYRQTTATGTFKILNASCPGQAKDGRKRGILLLLEAEEWLKKEKVSITFAWRKNLSQFKQKFKDKFHHNNHFLRFEEKIYTSMDHLFAQHHCTIIPYLQQDAYLKVIPLSALESLAAGKPVLVSVRSGVAEIIKREDCGVVFEPTPDGLRQAILEIKNNYSRYQKKCRKTAEKYFSQERFLKHHAEIYDLIARNLQRTDNYKEGDIKNIKLVGVKWKKNSK